MKIENQKIEAMERMKQLNLLPDVITSFQKEEKLYYSERGILYWIDGAIEEKIRNWEKETGNLVYHVIYNKFEFGRCYSLLYVSKHTDKWEMDREDIKCGYPLAYVINIDDECCSEFGSIGVKSAVGGLIRTV